MYIHADYKDYTRKWGKYSEEYVKFNNWDKMQTLSRMINYIYAYIETHDYDEEVINRCNKIKQYCDDYFLNTGTWVNFVINDHSVQIGIKMIEYCMNWIEENKIKDKKVVNKCWDIRRSSIYWRKDFKCQGV